MNMLNGTCILCPNGCDLKMDRRGDELIVTGNKCVRGIQFMKDEYYDPRRVLTTTVKTSCHKHPRLSVKTSKPIPKDFIFPAMTVINGFTAVGSVERGQVLIPGLLDLDVDVVATETLKIGAAHDE